MTPFARLRRALVEAAATVALALAIFIPVTTFGAQTIYIEQQSMIDTLRPGHHLVVDKLTPRFDPYSRGDIVIFRPAGDHDATPLIKRVVATEGEHVAIHDGIVWIDGFALDEPYTHRDPRTGLNEPTEPTAGRAEWDVGPGQLFVLGDHRRGSHDSRHQAIGLVDVDDVIGRAVFRYFPLDRIGPIVTPTYAPHGATSDAMG